MYVINALTAPDNYTTASTIDVGVTLRRIIIDNANQAIYWNLKIAVGGGGGNWDSTEIYMLPGSRRLPLPQWPVVGVRFRAAIAAASLPAGTTQAKATVMAEE